MPFTRIAIRAGKPAPYRKALAQGVQRALVATFNVPEDDIFMSITEHDEGSFFYGKHYLGIGRTDDLVLIQLTVTNSRNEAQKKALYAQIVENLANDPGVRREDVFINLVEVLKENWSFGNGIAQYAT
ncbi:tautomerase family protein [Paraburkholderia kururiensis]|uniref:tautomerase family protein n=1 Tax=Paraburkholderia kururiensis TaxID=984307 RepID=UPI0003481AA3|nr:tautomerase family protein [Paraburkholderia kururiensis]